MMDEIPSLGWTLIDVSDLGGDMHACEYCANERVRFVHTISHPDYPDIRVGCICASKLTGDGTACKAREQKLRNKASRYKQWLRNHPWQGDQEQTSVQGYGNVTWVATVYCHSGQWWWQENSAGAITVCNIPMQSASDAKRDYWLQQIERSKR